MTFGKKNMKKTRHETKEEREQDVRKKKKWKSYVQLEIFTVSSHDKQAVLPCCQQYIYIVNNIDIDIDRWYI